jgi:hypothetical protein
VPTIDLNDLASIGMIADVPSYQLPPEAWTVAENMRFRDGAPERFSGWESQRSGVPDNVHFLLPLITPSQTFWLWTSLTRAYVYDGVTDTEITRLSGVYSAGASRDWNGTILGGIPILNNGIDVPQFWSPQTIGTRLQNLTNWPASVRVKIIRSFGPFLVGFNITNGGTTYPHMVKWSHPADPGSVPVSWNEADPTKDTGQNDLPDVTAGIILDAVPLQSTMFIYKEGSVWQMNYVGGQYIFDFKVFLDTVGLLATRCVCVTGDGRRQVFMTQDDVIWHNGNQWGSVLDKKYRRRLFDDIDPTTYVNSFLFAHPLYNEVWICYPSVGSSIPNKAIVWNHAEGRDGTLSEINNINFVNAAAGSIETGTAEIWSDNPLETWDQDTGGWSNIVRRRIILATGTTKFYVLDRGLTKDGVAIVATLRREGLSIIGRKRNGEWIVDHEVMKMVDSLWPKVRGGTIRIRVGTQQVVDGAVTWGAYQNFDPTTGVVMYPSGPTAGRAMAVEFSSVTNAVWKLDGYKYNVKTMGRF